MKALPLLILALTTSLMANDLTLNGYVETYYSHLNNGTNSPYLYSFNKVNQFAINHALINATYAKENYRASLGLQTGAYVQANYAAEPDFWKSIYQANIGIKIANNLWLDAGIMPSHIGYESAIGKDNWNLTRSLMADNSPYFETGLKLTYEQSPTLTIAGFLLNGWQNISDTNTNKAIGTQITYKPTDTLLLNYSTFFGNEKPDNAQKFRHFHNLYAQLQLTPQTSIATLADFGFEDTKTWYGLALLGRYTQDKWAFGSRIETYSDPDQVITTTQTPHGFQTTGLSINTDYAFTPHTLLRTELRYLKSKDPVFQTATATTDHTLTLTTAFSVSF